MSAYLYHNEQDMFGTLPPNRVLAGNRICWKCLWRKYKRQKHEKPGERPFYSTLHYCGNPRVIKPAVDTCEWFHGQLVLF